MRDAPPQQRAASIAALEQETASLPQAIEARSHCLAAYRQLERAHGLSATVERSLSTATPGLTDQDSSSQKQLAQAESALRAAREAMTRCTQAVVPLRQLAR